MEKKRKMKRPTDLKVSANLKFNAFFEKMKEVLSDERCVILTDKELWVLVNHHLDAKDRPSYTTYKHWKGEQDKSVEELKSVSAEDAAEFRQSIDYARVIQKMNLTGHMMDEKNKNQWGSSWILERKFDDLKKQPMVQLSSNPTIQITAGDKESQKMIDQMINGETIDVEHEDID